MSQLIHRLQSRFPQRKEEISLLLRTLSLLNLSHQNVVFRDEGTFIITHSGKTEITESFFEDFSRINNFGKREDFISGLCNSSVSVQTSSLMDRLLRLFRMRKI
ncbi:MAG: hypothetical protein NUV47_03370 [Patescibacteria group bacterium]|nr:hypothetical protein [Patescibacteria group bacterium]